MGCCRWDTWLLPCNLLEGRTHLSHLVYKILLIHSPHRPTHILATLANGRPSVFPTKRDHKVPIRFLCIPFQSFIEAHECNTKGVLRLSRQITPSSRLTPRASMYRLFFSHNSTTSTSWVFRLFCFHNACQIASDIHLHRDGGTTLSPWFLLEVCTEAAALGEDIHRQWPHLTV